jgi:hypothetical protein
MKTLFAVVAAGMVWCTSVGAAQLDDLAGGSICYREPHGLPSGIDLPISGVWERVGKKYILTGTFDTNLMSFAEVDGLIHSNKHGGLFGMRFQWFTVEFYVPMTTRGQCDPEKRGGYLLYMYTKMRVNRKLTRIFTRGKGPKCKVKTDKKTGELVCTVKMKAKWLKEDYKTDQVDLNKYCWGFQLTPYGW